MSSRPRICASTVVSILSGSPTKPRSTIFSILEPGSNTVRFTLRASTMLPSLPVSPTALPPASLMKPTIWLLIEPASTISTISIVAASVMRRPPANSDLMPSRLSISPICGPPPCTTTGLMAVCSISTMSRAKSFARDIVLMEQTAINPVVVHGGGPQIGEMLKRLGIKSEFAGGLRITDAATIEIVEMVLAGSINSQIVGFINEAGGKAVGLTGKDGNMVLARKVNRTVFDPGSNIEKIVDLGFVGEPDKIDTTVLAQILGRELIPVLAPLAASAQGGTYNVNADTFAGAIAGALKAKRLLLLTDVPGVLDKSNKLIKQLSPDDARVLIADGTISGGMIPKVETCIYALEAGVEGVVILDGKVPHAVLLELLTDHGAGTLMMR